MSKEGLLRKESLNMEYENGQVKPPKEEAKIETVSDKY